MYSNDIYHHGILGMHWGVRRFQNKDGSLTSAGRKRYDVGEANNHQKEADAKSYEHKPGLITQHKQNLVNKYKEMGFGDEQAEMAATQRMKTEAVIAAVATVAVAVVATKAATRIGQDYCDKVIKQGAIIQNIGPDGAASFKDKPFFAAINSHDKRAYYMLYPSEKKQMMLNAGQKYNGIYKNQIKMNEDVKRASVRNAKKIFYDMMDNDASFKKEVTDTLSKTRYKAGLDRYKNTGKNTTRLYESFNQALATPEFQSAGLHNKYYDQLKKKGYDAILDINDTRYSGYKNISKSPTIFFGDKWEKISAQQIDDVTIGKNMVDYTQKLLLKQSVKVYGTYGAIGYTAQQISNTKFIDQYLKEHPNSKLTRKEILKLK